MTKRCPECRDLIRDNMRHCHEHGLEKMREYVENMQPTKPPKLECMYCGLPVKTRGRCRDCYYLYLRGND